MQVQIDTREPDTDALKLLFENVDTVDSVTVQQMECGDFVIGQCVFERKSLQTGDFADSMQDGRLETQIQRMYDEYSPAQSFLVLSGQIEDVMWNDRLNPQSAMGMIGSLMARWQIPLLLINDDVWMAEIMTKTAMKYESATNRVVRQPRSTPTVKSDTLMMNTVLALDGVGRKTAQSIISEFDGSLLELLQTTEDELQQIDGIGAKRSESITNQLQSAR